MTPAESLPPLDAGERRPVPGYEAYEVSDDGRCFRRSTGKELKPIVNQHGYLRFTLGLGRRRANKHFLAHAMVMLAFVSERPPGMHISHLNGIKTDNRLANLEYATPKQNEAMKVVHGRIIRGELTWMARLSPMDVLAIRLLRETGMKTATIAQRFKVTQCTVRDICARRRWKHVA